jgi:hypothetical protein
MRGMRLGVAHWVGLGFRPQAATYQDQSALLELEFRNGTTYRYLGVPVQVYREFLRSKSNGRYFNQYIRNRFRRAKIDPPRSGTAADSAPV